jgi:hypothetical protein
MAYRTIGMDRVLEVSLVAPGTAGVSLNGAVPGYRTFSSVNFPVAIATGDTCAYFMEAIDAVGNLTGPWERGFGTWQSAGNTFLRTKVIDGSSGAGVTVNFTTNVRIGYAAMTDSITPYAVPGGRLNGTTGPLGETPVGGVQTIYYVPYLHDRIVLWNGTGLQVVQFATTSLALGTMVTGQSYDVFGYTASGGGLYLITINWSGTNNRGSAPLAYFNGFLCQGTDPTKRYLGTIYTYDSLFVCDYANGAGNGAGGRRHIWNMYNRVLRPINMYDSTASWTYGAGAWQNIRNLPTPQGGIDFVRGLDEDAIYATSAISGTCGQGTGFYSQMAIDNVQTYPATCGMYYNSAPGTCTGNVGGSYVHTPGLGRHSLTLQVYAISGTITFGANYGVPGLEAHMAC